jgi:DNA-binding response OmpR family regulator
MRPKKVMLILAPDCDSRATMKFTLETWGYLAIVVDALPEATQTASESAFDLVIASPDFLGIKGALKALRAINPHVPQLLIAPGRKESPADLVADATMYGFFSQEEFRARIKVLSARKRGPRPQLKKPVQSEVPALSVKDRRFA